MNLEAMWQQALTQGSLLLERALQPSVAYQIGLMLVIAGLALFLRGRIGPPILAWLRAREGWPIWRYRVAVILHKRLFGFLFVALLWLAVLIMREVTWPSRSYVMALVANIATAWLIISLVTRFVSNLLLRRAIQYGAAIWIALRVTGTTEPARTTLEGAAFRIGEMQLSLWMLLNAAVTIGALIWTARLLIVLATDRLKRSEEVTPSMQVLAIKITQVLVYGVAIMIGLNAAGIDLTGLAVLSGAIGVGLGFGLQKVVSNLVSGVIILLDKSIKPGDVISLGETFGWINALSARYVSVVTRDGREYLIPNEDLITGQVVNWSHSDQFVRLDINFGTAYGDDPHLVRRVAIEAASGVDRVLTEPNKPVCHIVGFGDSSVDYTLRFWIADPRQGLTNIRGNVFLALWDAFKVNGISIPFPQREVRMLPDPAAPRSSLAPDAG
jgi:small-conductance mechanosensitive channel